MARTSAISDEVWASAIRAVMVDKMSLRTAAQKFGVHHMSLHRRIKDLRGDNKPEKAKAAQNAYLGSGSMMGMMNMSYPSMPSHSMVKPTYAAPPMRPVAHLPSNAPMMISPMMYSQELNPPQAKASPKRNSPVQQAANWSKALHAVETGHINVMQAASAFSLDPSSLHDHIKKRAEDMATVNPIDYLNLLDEYGIVKVLVARAELGVLMSMEELAELIQRTMFKQGHSCHGDVLQKVMYTFEVRNEHIMHTTIGNYHLQSPQQQIPPPLRQTEQMQHHQQAPQQSSQLYSHHPSAQHHQQQSTPHYPQQSSQHYQQASQQHHQQAQQHHQQSSQQHHSTQQQTSQLQHLQSQSHHPKQTIQQLQLQQQIQQQIQQQQQQYMHQRSHNPTLSDGSPNDMMMRPNYSASDQKAEVKPESRHLAPPSALLDVPTKSSETLPNSKSKQDEESSPSVQENSNKSGNRATKSVDVVEI